MDATMALHQTDRIVTDLIAGLRPEHRDAPTPCTDWTVHDLIGHMCSGGHMIAVTHAWDLASATDQPLAVDPDLAAWAHQVWSGVVPAEGRTGDGFAPVVHVPDDAPAIDRLVASTGRRP